jgi:HSP20 family protein
MIATMNRLSSTDRFFDQVFNDVMGAPIGSLAVPTFYAPPVDVRTSADELCISIDVPGLKQEDLELSVENGVLTVKGRRHYDARPEEQSWSSRRYGSFATSYALPDYVDLDRLSAQLADGVLTVRAPKHERAKPKKVPISIASSDDTHKQLNDGSK